MNRKLINKVYSAYAKLIRFVSSDGKSPLPPLIIWELSYKCNLRCKMCLFYSPDGKVPIFKDEMTLKQIKKVLENIERSYKWSLPRIHLTGGEPLIYKNFSKVVNYLKKLKFEYSITSNFTYLNNKTLNTLVKYPPADLRISIDGTRLVHDKIRGKGSFDKVMKNLKKIRKAKLVVPIRFNCTISKDNINCLDKLIDIAKENNAHLNFQHLMFLDDKHIKQHYKFCEKEFKCKPYPIGCKDKINPDKVHQLYFIIKKIKKTNPEITFLPNLKIKEIESYYNDLDNYVHSSYCYRIWAETRIAPNGKMYPCFDYYFGDLKTNSFNDIWNGKKAREFRIILKKKKLFPNCIRCCKL